MDKWTNRQTDGWTDNPITRCPRQTFQAGGIITCQNTGSGAQDITIKNAYIQIILKFSPYISHVQQILLQQKIKLHCTVLFIRETDRSDSFQEHCP